MSSETTEPLPRWIYTNPDSGTHLSVDHPVRSGECPDAADIRPATRANLVEELLSAWQIIAETEDRQYG